MSLFSVLGLSLLSLAAPERADVVAATYLNEACSSDWKERAGAYIPSKDRFVDITHSSEPTRIISKFSQSKKILMKKDAISYHCHPIPNSLTPPIQFYIPSGLFEPSGPPGQNNPAGDISDLLRKVSNKYKYHETFTPESRLVIVEEGLPPRVIAYGLKEKTADQLRRLAKNIWPKRKKHQNFFASLSYTPPFNRYGWHPEWNLRKLMRNSNELNERVIENFDYLMDTYMKDKCSTGQTTACEEPNLSELIETLNKSEYFYIRDHGYIDIENNN